jgi:hypothetical protein
VGVAGNQTSRAGDILRSLDLPTDLVATSADWNAAKPDAAFFRGTESEIRSAIVAAAQVGGGLSALEACLRDPAVLGTRTLEALLKDWGQDDLMPVVLRERVRQAPYGS